MAGHRDLPNRIGALELTFDALAVLISVDIDSDTLVIEPSVGMSDDYNHPLPSDFWRPMIGQYLIEAWSMQNSRGYVDALQLAFRPQSNAGPTTTVQLVSIASHIDASELRVVRRAGEADGPRV